MEAGFPVPVANLLHALPHRAPMIWIDEVTFADAEGGSCLVHVKPGQIYLDAQGKPHAFAAIEWLAQAFGFVQACHLQRQGGPQRALKRAFLVGIGEMECLSEIPGSGTLRVDVKLTREMAPLALVQGVMKNERGEDLVRAKLKLYFEA